MHAQHDKAKRWRPTLSVKTLVVVVTLVCCYAACWGPTKTQGVEDVILLVNDVDRSVLEDSEGRGMYGFLLDMSATATMPLVVRTGNHRETCRYYFWFFGFVVKLPFERDLELPEGQSLPKVTMMPTGILGTPPDPQAPELSRFKTYH